MRETCTSIERSKDSNLRPSSDPSKPLGEQHATGFLRHARAVELVTCQLAGLPSQAQRLLPRCRSPGGRMQRFLPRPWPAPRTRRRRTMARIRASRFTRLKGLWQIVVGTEFHGPTIRVDDRVAPCGHISTGCRPARSSRIRPGPSMSGNIKSRPPRRSPPRTAPPRAPWPPRRPSPQIPLTDILREHFARRGSSSHKTDALVVLNRRL